MSTYQTYRGENPLHNTNSISGNDVQRSIAAGNVRYRSLRNLIKLFWFYDDDFWLRMPIDNNLA